MEAAFVDDDALRDWSASSLFAAELRSLGSILRIEGWSSEFELQLKSLDSARRGKNGLPLWLVLSATGADHPDPPEALVWVNDEGREAFLRRFDEYATEETPTGKPKNNQLVANMARIQRAVLDDLWNSRGTPPASGKHWWELWLRDEPDARKHLEQFAAAVGATVARRSLHLGDRLVVRVQARWKQLQNLPISRVPVAEIRLPDLCDSYADLPRGEQDEYADDLADRISAAPGDAPAVCHLDTGIRRDHRLLLASIGDDATHSVIASEGPEDRHGHGTSMAGLALFGPLAPHLASTDVVELRHRLESVKLLPTQGANEYDSFGVVTADAVAQPESVAPNTTRVFCMPVSSPGDHAPGEPTLWSASIDALAAGVEIGRDGHTLTLLSGPRPDASRLFVISAGNVPDTAFEADHVTTSDLHPIENPAQSWNALIVGAHTDNTAVPSDPTFDGWAPLAPEGELSPHSRTGVNVPLTWPNRPDVCMEGGNVLTDGQGDFDLHPTAALLSTGHLHNRALAAANATSAATAQVARIAALVHAEYPTLWPETVRALIVHSAQWTPTMLKHWDATALKGDRVALLRRYGWGVADEQRTLGSAANAAHMIVEDSFAPYVPKEGKSGLDARFRLHRLPWPQEVLRGLHDADIVMRVTLSYFVEPAASRRGWRQRFSYPSHGLRFRVKRPNQPAAEFLAELERDPDAPTAKAPSDAPWLIGSQGRDRGSLHQDVWSGTAAELAEAGQVAVFPTKGWWHFNNRKDRRELPVRYALIVSLRAAEGIDLYTPIANEIQAEVAVSGS